MMYKQILSSALTLALLASIVPTAQGGCRSGRCGVRRAPAPAPKRPAPRKPAPKPAVRKPAPKPAAPVQPKQAENKKALVDAVQEAIENKKTFIAYFTNPNCDSCKYMKPIIDEITQDADHKVDVIEVTITDDNQTYYAPTYDITEIPTVIYFKDGKEVKRHDSNSKKVTKEEITQNIQENLEAESTDTSWKARALRWAKFAVPTVAAAGLAWFGYKKFYAPKQENQNG